MVENAGIREAAQVAFFIMITFPAALLLLVWGASTALDDVGVREEIVDAIVEALPLSEGEGRAQVEDQLDGVAAGAGTLGFLGGLVLIWSASGAIGALRYAIGAAWPSGEGLPYFQGKALDVGLTLVVAPVLLAALGLNLVDGVAGAFSEAPLLEGLVSVAVTEVVPAVALYGTLLVLYRVLPPSDASWRSAWVGALVAFVGVVLVRYGAELYFETIGDRAAIYGAIAGLLAVAISVYLLAIVAVVGANVAAVSARYANWQAVDDAIGAEAARDDGEGSVWADVRGMIRGLFLRARSRD